MKLRAVEGNTQWLDGGGMFGHVPKSLWSKWTQNDDQNRILLASRTLLVETDAGKLFLLEAGLGAFFDPKMKERYGVVENENMLVKNLNSMGIKDTDIHGIILSHLHFDHAGGLLSAYGDGPRRLLFPNARFYVYKRHWDYAQNPHLREHASFIPGLPDLLSASGRLVLLEGARHPDLDFGVTFHYSDGHTVGLMLTQLETENGPLVYVSDLIPGMAWVHLPITLGYDRFPELKIDEKRALYETIVDSKPKLFFTHDPVQPCALLQRDSTGRYFAEPAVI